MSRFSVDVSSLLGDPGASIEVDDEVPLDDIQAGDTVATFVEKPHVRAMISHTGIGLVLTGTVTAEARADCSRCLEPFTFDIEGSLEGGFLIPGVETFEETDEEWLPVHADAVDLMPAILAALLIEIPFAPVHDESCSGICSVCGCNLNQERCECAAPEANEPVGPFAVLKELVPPDE